MLEGYPKLHRLMLLMVSMAARYEPNSVFLDESAAHDTLTWRTSQVLIMRKMYARELERVFLDLLDKQSRIERARKKTGIQTLFEPINQSINTTLATVRELRRENGAWLLRVQQYLHTFQFTEQVLSIADTDAIMEQAQAELFNRFKNAKNVLEVS